MGIAPVNSIRIFFREFGEGEPVVLIHHLAGTHNSWREVSLRTDKRVITYDLRGHGRSSVPMTEYLIEDHREDLRGLLEFLDVEDPILVGHSIGSLIALDYALKYSVKKLVLIGALVSAPNPEPYERYVDVAMRLGMIALAEYRKNLGDFSEALIKNARAWNNLLSVYSENSPLGYKYATLGLLKARNYVNDLERLDVPVKVIYGSQDKLIANLETFRQRVRNLSVAVIEGVGHFVNFEAPERLSEEINGFV
ncbi:MAG: alpha/beta hydrolase [Sulfolobales archaeon]|nr:alpha/beta hydrolase [Sulfolobales archaeon]MCG2894517.1 alpha/beta hydrolase [Sulfolobales archaeon]MCG2910203.1 alpha/beta hydrolase [Sulfolobales archaeon]